MLTSSGWPRISVVTPCLNAAGTIRETVESILQQDYPNLEYIVVDGGSKDGTIPIVLEYSRHIDVFLTGRDRTMYDAIAKGFAHASGDILTWLNSDDTFEPGALARVGEFFRRHPRRHVVYFDGLVWKQGWKIPNRLQHYVGFPELLRGHILYQDAVFFTRRAYEAVGGLERTKLRVAGDYDLWLKLSAKYRFTHIRGVHVSCYRLSPEQLSGDWGRYLAEMAVARRRALQEQPAFTRWIAPAGVMLRKIRTALSRPEPYFELQDENAKWLNAAHAPAHAGLDCRCPVCASFPTRVLFTALDPGEPAKPRTARHVYYCAECRVAFLYPPPSGIALQRLSELAARIGLDRPLGPPAGIHSPFRRPSLLKHNPLFRFVASQHCFSGVREVRFDCKRDAMVIEFASESKHADRFWPSSRPGKLCTSVMQSAMLASESGFGDLLPKGLRCDTVVLNDVLQRCRRPTELLKQARRALRPGGRIYVTMPNLDSAWLRYYGPTWCGWNPPFHALITGKRGLARIAGMAGLRVFRVRSYSSAGALCMSDALAVHGLSASFIQDRAVIDDELAGAAEAASGYSRIAYDWRLKGDRLIACLTA